MINQAIFDRIEDAIDQFEETWSPESRSEIETLLSQYGLQDDCSAIAELIRIDIELRYEHGYSIDLRDYLSRFDVLLDCPDKVAEIAFEDFRSRCSAGQPLSISRWSSLPGVSQKPWFQELSRDASLVRAKARIAKLESSLAPDAAFESALEATGFELVNPIGEGAFSRVYLAKQTELADRYVVLKIVSEALAEPDCMAQLQHTNIVPIYSSHRVLSRSVICMPYTGSVTLADFLKCKADVTSRIGESLVTTVKAKIQDTQTSASPADATSLPEFLKLPAAHEGAVQRPLEVFRSFDCFQLATWIFHRVAGALSHAHARDVLHNDLKPSNVLIRNDGEPALLDFNLSQSISTRTARHAGGTLPYMSPESHRALMGQETPADPRSDLYSLGVMLFEFVTGRLPFAPAATAAPIDLSPAIEARREAPDWNADDHVTPGLRAIVNRCLQFEPEDRYASADQLQTDLLCEQENRSLVYANEPLVNRGKKFTRRHPRLIAVSLASALFLGVLGPVVYQLTQTRGQYRQLASQAALNEFAEESAPYLCQIQSRIGVNAEPAVETGIRLLERYTLLDRGAFENQLAACDEADRGRFRHAVFLHTVEVANLEVRRLNALRVDDEVESLGLERLDRLIDAATWLQVEAPSRALLFLHAHKQRLGGKTDASRRRFTEAQRTGPSNSSEVYLEAKRLIEDYRFPEATDLLNTLAETSFVPPVLRWTALGRSQYAESRYGAAKLAYTQAIALVPALSSLHVMRASCHISLGRLVAAKADITVARELTPENPVVWSKLAEIQMKTDMFSEAVASLGQLLERSPDNVWGLIKRSECHRELGQIDQAEADLASAYAIDCDNVTGLIARAHARVQTDPDAALADYKKAYRLNPKRPFLLANQAQVLSVHLKRYPEAIEIYEELLDRQPNNDTYRIDKALCLLRIGDAEQALSETRLAMQDKKSGRTVYQAACVHALHGTPPSKRRAIALLAHAFELGYSGKPLGKDPDLASLNGMKGFELIKQVRRLSKAGGVTVKANARGPSMRAPAEIEAI